MRFDWREIRAELGSRLGTLDGLEVDAERTEHFAEEIASGRLSSASNRLEEPLEPVGFEDVDVLEELAEDERRHHARLGLDALARGEVAVAVLNGGMATRFGGVVKGVLEALGGRSFLELKLAQARRSGPAPFLIMNSFVTHEATLEFLEARGLGGAVMPFLQSVALRLTPEGELFRERSGALSLYAPGHGDFPEALRRSGALESLRSRGVRAVLLCNVDNLGAEPDPEILGYHLAHERELTVELALARPGDVGGTPARVRGRIQIVEGLRFPPGFDPASLRFLNTNTTVLSLDVLEADHPLTWFYVEKQVEGRPAVQMERLVGELSAFVDASYLVTPRDGLRGRFLPVKTPEDLEALRSDATLEERFVGL